MSKRTGNTPTQAPAPSKRDRSESSTNTTRQRARRKRKRSQLARVAAQLAAATEKRQQERTLLAQARFLVTFAQTANILRSAEAAGVHRRTVTDWLAKPGAFKALY